MDFSVLECFQVDVSCVYFFGALLLFCAGLFAAVSRRSPGVAAGFTEQGSLVHLSFDLKDPRAKGRLDLAKPCEG